MTTYLSSVIRLVHDSRSSYCKYISANDTGKTGGHQSGFYVSKEAAKELFSCDCIKGTNEDRRFEIEWPDGTITQSRFVYYGQGTRDESRITKFGRGFEYLNEDYCGCLLILSKIDNNYFKASILSSDDDIESFSTQFNLPASFKCYVINGDYASINEKASILDSILQEIVTRYHSFPKGSEMARFAQESYNLANHISTSTVIARPDDILLRWLDTESRLFYLLEDKICRQLISKQFDSIEDFTQTAKIVLNRRKARAGKSLERHLAQIFRYNELLFEEQCITEENKKPDFIFPGEEEYHNLLFPANDLVFLGAKTTCKDRWRQVLNEADRISIKYLFTLQQGISSNQLLEMSSYNVRLVVPKDNLSSFPREFQSSINCLASFISIVREKQSRHQHLVMF